MCEAWEGRDYGDIMRMPSSRRYRFLLKKQEVEKKRSEKLRSPRRR